MKFFRFVFWFAVVVVAGLLCTAGFLFSMVTPVHASDWNEMTCKSVAADVGTFYDIKASGVTWEQAEPQVMQSLDEAFHLPNSYIKDVADAKRGYFMAHFVWHHDLAKADMQAIIFDVCMKHWRGIGI